jgi:CheY-like chemotaxis protein
LHLFKRGLSVFIEDFVKSPLHILLIEDNQFDAELIAHELRKLGQPFCVDTIQSEQELRRTLDHQSPDLILSDHGLPSFDGFTALDIVREARPEMPFIFVSGSNDQQMVVDMYDRGANDYVFKRDLVDLCPAVQRALKKKPESEPPATIPEQPGKTVAAVPTSRLDNQLLFCPRCRQTRDTTGNLVEISQVLAAFSEATLRRRPCPSCAKAAGALMAPGRH